MIACMHEMKLGTLFYGIYGNNRKSMEYSCLKVIANVLSYLAIDVPFCMCKILRLQSSLEESRLNEKQLKHKLEIQTETLNNKIEELSAVNGQTQSSMTSEVMEVQNKIMDLENVKVGRINFKQSHLM